MDPCVTGTLLLLGDAKRRSRSLNEVAGGLAEMGSLEIFQHGLTGEPCFGFTLSCAADDYYRFTK
jgi:hypothetical protein